jgi:hypothetical protein
MKTIILVFTTILAASSVSVAQSDQRLTIKAGEQKIAFRGELKVEFVSVLEDSRCPADVQCIWAGNARVKIKVTDWRGEAKLFELNTTAGAKGDQFGGYAINLVGLTPEPKRKGVRYAATFSIERLKR